MPRVSFKKRMKFLYKRIKHNQEKGLLNISTTNSFNDFVEELKRTDESGGG
jgi:hypothetical protein